MPIPQFALAPDGRALAFVAGGPANKPTLWLRHLDAVEARPVLGTEEARDPFWSPDGRWIGFFAEETLTKVAVAGGMVQTVARNISDPRGASWGPDDTILFGTGSGAIYRVAAASGAPSDIWLLTIADPTKPVRVVQSPGDQMHANFSPDGGSIAYTSNESGRFEVYVQSLRPPARKWPISVNGGYEPRCRPTARSCITWRMTRPSWWYRCRLVPCHLACPGRSSRRRCMKG